MLEIPISEQTRDRLFSRGSKTDTLDQIIIHLLDKTEVNPLDCIPSEFEDYWQLEKYLNENHGFIIQHKIGNASDSVKARIIGSDNIASMEVYYKKQDVKFVRCQPDECLELLESNT